MTTRTEMKRALKKKGIVFKKGDMPSDAKLERLYKKHIKGGKK